MICWPGPSAEMCRGVRCVNLAEGFAGILLRGFSGHSFQHKLGPGKKPIKITHKQKNHGQSREVFYVYCHFQRAKNGALEPWSLDLRFWGAPISVQSPQNLDFEGFRSDLGQNSGAPQTQIQRPRIRRPILGHLIFGPPINEETKSGEKIRENKSGRGFSQFNAQQFLQKNPRVRKLFARNSGAGNGCANLMEKLRSF